VDRLLTLRETAELLQINERTALRLAQAGDLPASRIGGQWRVQPSALERWLLSARSQGEVSTPIEPGLFSIECVLLDHPAETVSEVLGAVADNLAATGRLIYPDVYAAALREREGLMSTGVGEGVAIPHARHDINRLFRQPTSVFVRLARPIDFGAVDERPVDLVFTVAAPSDSSHLATLAAVMKLARDPDVRESLRAAAVAEDVLAILNGSADA
jgi:PTS system nitrogen regulatory IIA component